MGELFILRSFASSRQRLAALRRQIIVLWLLALIAALVVTYLVARNSMRPVAELDRAAAEIAKQNYDYRINVSSQDELGRLAETFQSMCESIRQARMELIRQERIATIGQLSTSIVHDLRNPLAAIYAGAEMLMADRKAFGPPGGVGQRPVVAHSSGLIDRHKPIPVAPNATAFAV